MPSPSLTDMCGEGKTQHPIPSVRALQ